MTTPVESGVVERVVRISARPETVFAFFTAPSKMVQWKGITASLDPRHGGIYRVVMNSRDTARGEYLEVTPHSRVVFTWGWEGDAHPIPPVSSTVGVTLTPDGNATILRLRHLGLPDTESQNLHTMGWEH